MGSGCVCLVTFQPPGRWNKEAGTAVDGVRAPLPSDIHYTFFLLEIECSEAAHLFPRRSSTWRQSAADEVIIFLGGMVEACGPVSFMVNN